MPERREIVILTDSETQLADVTEKLRSDGWRVHTARRAYEAVISLGRSHAEILLVCRDALLADGEEFLRHVHELENRPWVLAESDDANPVPDLGHVDIWLPHPFRYEDLSYVLEFQIRDGVDLRRRLQNIQDNDEVGGDASARRYERIVQACCNLSELERDRDQLLTQALEYFMEITRAERASLLLRQDDGESLTMVRRQGFPRSAPSPITVRIGEDLSGTVARRGEPLLVEVDARGRGRSTRGYLGHSFLIVPLKWRSSVVGVINLTNKQGGEAFDQRDLADAMLLANQTAITLANADNLAELHEMTVIDPLTHLFNRRHFDRELKKELERARRYGRRLTLALLDIDNFKLFNDINGYVTGDAIIKEVGKIIQANFREVDIVTRWGGDEFAVLLPDTGTPGNIASAKNFIERVRSAVENADFSGIVPEDSGRITLSVGVATYPLDCRNEAELFRKANGALHRAKKLGNNRTIYARDLEGNGSPEEPAGDGESDVEKMD